VPWKRLLAEELLAEEEEPSPEDPLSLLFDPLCLKNICKHSKQKRI
jgi:hypothetical protein